MFTQRFLPSYQTCMPVGLPRLPWSAPRFGQPGLFMPSRYDTASQAQFNGFGLGAPELPLPVASTTSDTLSLDKSIQSGRDDLWLTTSSAASGGEDSESRLHRDIDSQHATSVTSDSVKEPGVKANLIKRQLLDINRVLTEHTKSDIKKQPASTELTSAKNHLAKPYFQDTMHELEEINETVRELDDINQVLLAMETKARSTCLQRKPLQPKTTEDNNHKINDGFNEDEVLDVKKEAEHTLLNAIDIHQSSVPKSYETENASLHCHANDQPDNKRPFFFEKNAVVSTLYNRKAVFKLENCNDQSVADEVVVAVSGTRRSAEEGPDNFLSSLEETISNDTTNNDKPLDGHQRKSSIKMPAPAVTDKLPDDNSNRDLLNVERKLMELNQQYDAAARKAKEASKLIIDDLVKKLRDRDRKLTADQGERQKLHERLSHNKAKQKEKKRRQKENKKRRRLLGRYW